MWVRIVRAAVTAEAIVVAAGVLEAVVAAEVEAAADVLVAAEAVVVGVPEAVAAEAGTRNSWPRIFTDCTDMTERTAEIAVLFFVCTKLLRSSSGEA